MSHERCERLVLVAADPFVERVRCARVPKRAESSNPPGEVGALVSLNPKERGEVVVFHATPISASRSRRTSSGVAIQSFPAATTTTTRVVTCVRSVTSVPSHNR